ncbi:MAG: glycoside hydrolase family 3 N-terminal domain-containing protein [Actinomycetota bacterium]
MTTLGPDHRSPALPLEDRVADLLGRMTIEEKLAQLGSVWSFDLLDGDGRLAAEAARTALRHGIGEVTRVAGATSLDAAGVEAATVAIDDALRTGTRLGIPAIVHEECVSGYMARDAVVFPAPIGQAASWDPDLIEEIADVTRAEMLAAGARHGLAPVLDVARDPRWGRMEETFGEDPYLVAALGVAFIRGLQGDDLRTGVLATAKHYVGHGAPLGGRNAAPQTITARELRDVHLRPFAAAVEAGVATVMHAYPELDGVPMLANTELLVDVLRDELGFDGLLVSDYNAIDELVDSHQHARDVAEATLTAIESGLDLELPTTFGYGAPLAELLARGAVDHASIDRAVARMLRVKLRLGLLDGDQGEAPPRPSAARSGELARLVAVRSCVLLTNEAGALPLAPDADLALIGPNAVSGRNLLGDYAHAAHIELLRVMRGRQNAVNAVIPEELHLEPRTGHLRSIADELLARHPGTVRVAEGCGLTGDDRTGFAEAVEIARRADAAVVVLGERSGLTPDCTCGEARDRTDLGLPGVQQELLDAIVATGTPVVLVTVGGRPLALERAAATVAAWLHVWPPGEEGAAGVVDVLLGERESEGRLPVTVPRHVGQIPVHHAPTPTGARSRWWDSYVDRDHEPLFAFGHGLGYTTFEVDAMRISADRVEPGGHVVASVAVRNTGSRAGTTVVQLYAAHVGPRSVTRPVRELVGFRRVDLPAGGVATVDFVVDTRSFAFTTRDDGFAIEPGPVRLAAGLASDHLPATAVVDIVGEVTPVPLAVPFTGSTVHLHDPGAHP